MKRITALLQAVRPRSPASVLYVAAAVLMTLSIGRVVEACGSPGTGCQDEGYCTDWAMCGDIRIISSYNCCCDTHGPGQEGCCQYVCTSVECHNVNNGALCGYDSYAHNGYWESGVRCQNPPGTCQ